MNALLLLLVCEVTAPLGPYARPGVPVPLVVKGETEIVVEGWRYAAEPLTIVHPPVVPCVVRNAAGKELLRLEAVPDKTLLVGVEGAVPPDYAARIPRPDGYDVRAVSIDPTHKVGLGLFDRVVTRDRLQAEPKELKPPARPRRGNIAPAVYDLIPEPAGASGALLAARLIGIAAAIVMAIQILLYGRGLVSARFARWSLGFVAVVGALAGAAGAYSEYTPVFEARIVIRGTPNDFAYRCFGALGPGAEIVPGRSWTPLFYRSAGQPWWTDGTRRMSIPPGVLRLFLDRDPPPSPVPIDAKDGPKGLRALAPPGPGRIRVAPWTGGNPTIAWVMLLPRN